MPNGPSGILLLFRLRATAFSKSTVWLGDMCPYLLRSHCTMASAELATQGAPGFGTGDGGGGAGAAGVLNTCVVAQALVVSPSLARTRQKCVLFAVSAGAVYVVCPGVSATMPCATTCVNAWSSATWNSYCRLPMGPARSESRTVMPGDVVPEMALLTGATGAGGLRTAFGKISNADVAKLPVFAPSSARTRQ